MGTVFLTRCESLLSLAIFISKDLFAFFTVAIFQIPIFCILSLIETLFLRSGIEDETEMKDKY